MGRISKVFELVPTVQSRRESPAPMAFVPALPVRLKSKSGLAQYAIIDTAAQLSTITSSIARHLGILQQSVGSKIIIASGESISCEIVKIPAIICDETFSPWVQLDDVPFAILPGTEPLMEQNRITLGYDSCLSQLRLTIDFTRSRLRVSAPTRLLTSKDVKLRAKMPSRIIDGENLIKLGSYDAAVALIAAGLEETIISDFGTRHKTRTFGQLQTVFAQQNIPVRLHKRLDNIALLRNKAVHGSLQEHITEDEAKAALRDAKMLSRYFAVRAEEEILKDIREWLGELSAEISLGRKWRSFWTRTKPVNESAIDLVIRDFLREYAESHNAALEVQAHTGMGTCDYVVHRGTKKVIFELKPSYGRWKTGIETQLPAYMKAMGADAGVFLVIAFEGRFRKGSTELLQLIERRNKICRDHGIRIDIAVINADKPPSASRRKSPRAEERFQYYAPDDAPKTARK